MRDEAKRASERADKKKSRLAFRGKQRTHEEGSKIKKWQEMKRRNAHTYTQKSPFGIRCCSVFTRYKTYLFPSLVSIVSSLTCRLPFSRSCV